MERPIRKKRRWVIWNMQKYQKKRAEAMRGFSKKKLRSVLPGVSLISLLLPPARSANFVATGHSWIFHVSSPFVLLSTNFPPRLSRGELAKGNGTEQATQSILDQPWIMHADLANGKRTIFCLKVSFTRRRCKKGESRRVIGKRKEFYQFKQDWFYEFYSLF